MRDAEGRDARRRAQGIAALLAVQVLFGLFPLFVVFALDGFTPRAIAAWRIVVGALVLGAIAWWRHGRAFLPLRSDLARLALASFLGIFANQLLALEGMERTSVVHAGLLFTLIPVFTYGVALACRQERFAGPRALGIAVALAGVVVLGREESGVASTTGDLLIIANCLCYAAYLVVAKELLARLPSLVVIAWVFLLSVPAVPLVALGQDLWPREASSLAWNGLICTLLFPTILAYLINTFALKRVGASTTAAFVYLQPLVSVGAGVLVLDETIGPSAATAALLIFVGLGCVLRRRAS